MVPISQNPAYAPPTNLGLRSRLSVASGKLKDKIVRFLHSNGIRLTTNIYSTDKGAREILNIQRKDRKKIKRISQDLRSNLVRQYFADTQFDPANADENFLNTAMIESDLILHANICSSGFLARLKEITGSDGIVGESHNVKSDSSLKQKVDKKCVLNKGRYPDEYLRETVVMAIGDALRTSIVVPLKDQAAFIEKLRNALGGDLVIINKWAENNSTGYGAIHCNWLYRHKSENPDSADIQIITEIQIHDPHFYSPDGESAKSLAHAAYEAARSAGNRLAGNWVPGSLREHFVKVDAIDMGSQVIIDTCGDSSMAIYAATIFQVLTYPKID